MFSGGDTNLYGYTWNDPVNYIDPNGENGYAIAAGALVSAFAVYKVYKAVKEDPEFFDKLSNKLREKVPPGVRDMLGIPDPKSDDSTSRGPIMSPIIPIASPITPIMRQPASTPSQADGRGQQCR